MGRNLWQKRGGESIEILISCDQGERVEAQFNFIHHLRQGLAASVLLQKPRWSLSPQELSLSKGVPGSQVTAVHLLHVPENRRRLDVVAVLTGHLSACLIQNDNLKPKISAKGRNLEMLLSLSPHFNSPVAYIG